MAYRILLFDVDDTLLDFDANETESFRSMMEEMGELWTQEIYATYKELNRKLWRTIERGEISVEEGVNRRFSDLMAHYGKEVDGRLWEQAYRRYLNQGLQEIPQVHQVLGKLKKDGYELYVITNGVEETQTSRMARSGLDKYFRQLFISGKIGAGKPSREFFDHVKSHVERFEAREALVIGDSLTSDIKGGIDAGIDTCWFCRNKGEEERETELTDKGIRPSYMIEELTELLGILQAKAVKGACREGL